MNKKEVLKKSAFVLVKVVGAVSTIAVTVGLAKYGIVMTPDQQAAVNQAVQAVFLGFL